MFVVVFGFQTFLFVESPLRRMKAPRGASGLRCSSSMGFCLLPLVKTCTVLSEQPSDYKYLTFSMASHRGAS